MNTQSSDPDRDPPATDKPADDAGDVPPSPDVVDYVQKPKRNRKFDMAAFWLLYAFSSFLFLSIAAGGIYLVGRVLQQITIK